jgi:uncharacterized Ntn-hydrolase superfamily protein
VRRATPTVSTFSIVARDPATGDLGVAVESKFLAVGAVVPWARAGVGAIATQAHTDTRMGPNGLALLAGDAPAQDALDQLLSGDPTPAARQVGVVDATGRAANYTGPDCTFWAGGATGDGFCCQGNILTGPEVVAAMVEGYTTASGRGTFAHRLLTALEAGQAAGGDSRGQQSAAILIVREGGGYGGGNDRLIDLRVDDHPTPIVELRRLVLLHRVYFDLDEADLVPFDDLRLAYVAGRLAHLGFLPSADAPRAEVESALRRWAGRENLEERLRADEQLDSVVLEWLARDT